MTDRSDNGTVLAIASGGGHWLQLCRLASAWEGCRVVSACTADAPPLPGSVECHHRLRDATRWTRRDLVLSGLEVARLVIKVRPDVVVTTGALPGLWGVLWGRLVGAHTVWIDSLANVERISASGRVASFIAHEWWTQWPHLSAEHEAETLRRWTFRRRPSYRGAVW